MIEIFEPRKATRLSHDQTCHEEWEDYYRASDYDALLRMWEEVQEKRVQAQHECYLLMDALVIACDQRCTLNQAMQQAKAIRDGKPRPPSQGNAVE